MADLHKCPLNQADCQKLNQLLVSCNNTTELLNKLEQIGLDVQHLRDHNNAHLDFASKTKAAFFPAQP